MDDRDTTCCRYIDQGPIPGKGCAWNKCALRPCVCGMGKTLCLVSQSSIILEEHPLHPLDGWFPESLS